MSDPSPVERKANHRRGDVHPVTGLVYWDTWYGKERWRNAETVTRWKQNLMRAVVKWQKADIPRHRAAQKRNRIKHGRKKNAECREYRMFWKRDKRANDPLFKLRDLASSRIYLALKRKQVVKCKRTVAMLGCSITFLRAHIESQFRAGMTWKTQGYYGWHIDHRIPLSSARTIEQLEKLFHYTNLQPLWWHENFAKGNKIPA